MLLASSFVTLALIAIDTTSAFVSLSSPFTTFSDSDTIEGVSGGPIDCDATYDFDLFHCCNGKCKLLVNREILLAGSVRLICLRTVAPCGVSVVISRWLAALMGVGKEGRVGRRGVCFRGRDGKREDKHDSYSSTMPLL